jgi:hypothetical protein
MLTALIRKDDATEVPRLVEDMAAARALLTEGMPVFILEEDGAKTPVLAEEPADEPAAEEAAAPAAKKAARKR